MCVLLHNPSVTFVLRQSGEFDGVCVCDGDIVVMVRQIEQIHAVGSIGRKMLQRKLSGGVVQHRRELRQLKMKK